MLTRSVGVAVQSGPPHPADEDTEARGGQSPAQSPPPASSFILWVRSPPPPTGLPERVTGSPQVTQKIPRLSAAAGGLFLLFSMFSMCVVTLARGGQGCGRGGPSGTATGTAGTSQGAFGKRRALSVGLGGRSLHHQKGQSRTVFTLPQGWLCALQVARAVFLNSHTDLMRLELSVLFR